MYRSLFFYINSTYIGRERERQRQRKESERKREKEKVLTVILLSFILLEKKLYLSTTAGHSYFTSTVSDKTLLQCCEDPYDALSCSSFFVKEPLITGLFC